MPVSPFDHPFLSGLTGDASIAEFFSAEADLAAMLKFEAALALAEADEGVIPRASADAIAACCETFSPDMDELAKATARDGVVAPELVRQLRVAVGEDHAAYVHFGATSQDVIDTSLVLRLHQILPRFGKSLDTMTRTMVQLVGLHGDKQLTGRTRMQDALPITVADRINSWRAPLMRERETLRTIKPKVFITQFGGAVGTLEKLGNKGPQVTKRLAERLGLGVAPDVWHSERDGLVELASWLSLVTGSLGKMGQDIALMAQNPVAEIRLAGGGKSSAMPHKQNPVGAEVLVALARFNAVQVSAMHQAMVHENERSGAAWTLEWLVLPQMINATAGALRTANALLAAIDTIGN